MKMRTRDVATCADISPYVIRQYIDAGLLGPVYQSENNYRWIDPRAVPQACIWRTLQEAGLTTEQLWELKQSRTPEKILELFWVCSEQLNREILTLRKRQVMLNSYALLIKKGRRARPGGIELRTLPARPVQLIPLEQTGGAMNMYESLCQSFTQAHNIGCPLGFAYNTFFGLLEAPEQPAQMVSFCPQGRERLPAGEYLVGTAACGCGEEDGLARRMFDYALQNWLEFCGPAYTVYLHDAVSVAEQEQYLLQVTVTVNRTGTG